MRNTQDTGRLQRTFNTSVRPVSLPPLPRQVFSASAKIDAPENVGALHQLAVLRLEHEQRQYAREVRELLARHVVHEGVEVGDLPQEVRARLDGQDLKRKKRGGPCI